MTNWKIIWLKVLNSRRYLMPTNRTRKLLTPWINYVQWVLMRFGLAALTKSYKEGGANIMPISQAEWDAIKYAARDRDFIASVGLATKIEPMQLKSGKWRA